MMVEMPAHIMLGFLSLILYPLDRYDSLSLYRHGNMHFSSVTNSLSNASYFRLYTTFQHPLPYCYKTR